MRLVRPILTTGAALAVVGALIVPPAAAAELDLPVEVTVDRSSAATYERFEVSVDMKVPDSAQAGDTFRLELGPDLVMESGAIDLKDAGGNVVATVKQEGDALVYTFTDFVTTHNNVSTTLNFWASADKETVAPGDTVDVAIKVNGELVPGPSITIEGPGTGGSHAEFKWMNWVAGSRDEAQWGIASLKRHYDVKTLTVTDTPGPGLELKCDASGWPMVFVGPDRSVFGTPDGWGYKLPESKYTVDCTPERMIVTLKGTADAPAVRAFQDVEVRGLVTVTESRGEYTNSGTIVEDGTALPGRSAVLSQYGSSGSGRGDLAGVSVGDFVWLDTDRDGVQDEGEAGIPGVTLVLTGPDGQPVKDVNGKDVGPVVTDAEGRYTFPNLPVLQPGQSYTVTVDTANSAEALEGLAPTTPGAGDDRGKDSSSGSAQSEGLTVKGQSDTTLDFGFVAQEDEEGTDNQNPNAGSVSVGDFVWLDTDRDGVQDEGEAGIPGVTLVLTGPDGQPAKDVNDKAVGPVVTDAEGRYSFPNLPVLKDGEAYTVTVDTEGSAEALKGLVPTKANAGEDRAADSSTGSATSKGLTIKGESDTTLDFGFHAKDEEGTRNENPDNDGTKDGGSNDDGDDQNRGGSNNNGAPKSGGNPTDREGTRPVAPTNGRSTTTADRTQRTELARTGAELGLLAAAGSALVASGGGLLAWRRRRDSK